MDEKNDYYAGKGSLWKEDWFGGMFVKGAWASETDFDQIMSPEHDSYHPYCCNACKRGSMQNLTLVRCSGCKVVKYCCRDHQKKDWPVHKKWCKAFVKATDDIKNDSEEKQIIDHAEWCRRQQEINTRLVGLMGDIRHSACVQMTWVQPHCRRCFRSGRVPGVDLVVCPSCYGVAVCKMCLGDEPLNCETMHGGDKQECESYLTYLCCDGMIVENGCPFLAASDTNCNTTFCPKDWFEYFDKKGSDFDTGADMQISFLRFMAPFTCFLTDGLTMPMSIQMFLEKLDMLQEEELCIHILGGDIVETNASRIFVELGRLNPQLKRLDLVMVGPNLPFDKSYAYSNFLLQHETPSHLEGAFQFVPGVYHNSSAASGPVPDLFVAFNPGIHDPSYFQAWKPTLELIKTRTGIPLCITGFTFQEVESDVKELKMLGFQEKIPTAANPFQSMRPFLDPMREETDFCYGNKAFAILEGSSD